MYGATTNAYAYGSSTPARYHGGDRSSLNGGDLYSNSSSSGAGLGGGVMGERQRSYSHESADTAARIEASLIERSRLFPGPKFVSWSNLAREDRRRIFWVELFFDVSAVMVFASLAWMLRYALFQTVLQPFDDHGREYVVHDFILIAATFWVLWNSSLLYLTRFGSLDLAHLSVVAAISVAFIAFAVDLPSHITSSATLVGGLLGPGSGVLRSLAFSVLAVRFVLAAAYGRLIVNNVSKPFALVTAIAHLACAIPFAVIALEISGGSFARGLLWVVFVADISLPAIFVVALPLDWQTKLNHVRFIERFGALVLLVALYVLHPVILARLPPHDSTPSYSYTNILFDVAATVVLVISLLALYMSVDAAEHDTHAIRRSCLHGYAWTVIHPFLIVAILILGTACTQLSLVGGSPSNAVASSFTLSKPGAAPAVPMFAQRPNPLDGAGGSGGSGGGGNPMAAFASSAAANFLPPGAFSSIAANAAAAMGPLAGKIAEGAHILLFVGLGGVVLMLYLARTVHDRVKVSELLAARESRLRGDIPGYSNFHYDSQFGGSSSGHGQSKDLPRALQLAGLAHLFIYVVVIGLCVLVATKPTLVVGATPIQLRLIAAGVLAFLVLVEAVEKRVTTAFLRPSSARNEDSDYYSGDSSPRGRSLYMTGL